MGRDATRAAELLPPENPWRSISYFYAGASRYLSGNLESGKELLEEGARRGAANAPIVQVFCLVQLTLLHLDRDDLERALRVIAQAREQLERFNLGDYPVMATFFAASSLTRALEGQIEDAAADGKRAAKMLSGLAGFPDWLVAAAGIFLARAYMLLDDPVEAERLLVYAAEIADRIPDAPTLRRWLSESQSSASAMSARSRSRRADARRVENASVSPEPPLVQRDRRAQLRFAEHGQDPGAGDLQEARCLLPR